MVQTGPTSSSRLVSLFDLKQHNLSLHLLTLDYVTKLWDGTETWREKGRIPIDTSRFTSYITQAR